MHITPPAAKKPSRFSVGMDWPVVFWISLLHVGALAAPFFFTWKAVIITIVLGWATGGVGICLGYHRLFTHRSFQTYRPIRWLIASLGTLAGQGPPINWVAVHRKHHQHSDQDADPHSPRHGKWWSHMLWLMPHVDKEYWAQLYDRYAPDLVKERFLRFLDKSFIWWHLSVGVALLCIGWVFWDAYTGVSFLVYGMFLRLVYVLHITWLVNSATHIWGYRNYDTPDNSRNLWWVGLLAYGEGWHNNHHAFQQRARHGHRWWELDATYLVIWVMKRLGLAWNVVCETPDHSAKTVTSMAPQTERIIDGTK